MKQLCDEKIVEILKEKLPDYFPRSKVEELTGGLFKPGTMAVLDREGKGPPPHRMGRRRVYIKEEFLEWLVAHFSAMEVYTSATNCRAVRCREGGKIGSGEAGGGAEN